jgi:hypothetical protein
MRATSLAGLLAPTPVDVRGVLVSPDAVVSPVTGQAAAILQFYVIVLGAPARGFFSSPTPDRLLESGIYGDAVLIRVDGATVRVPVGNLDVYFAGANRPAVPLPPTSPLVDDLRPETQMLARQGGLHYRELFITSGERVRLRGVVAPMEGDNPYRTGAGVSFMLVDHAQPGGEPARLSIDVPEHAS